MGPYGPIASGLRLTTAESLVGLILLNTRRVRSRAPQLGGPPTEPPGPTRWRYGRDTRRFAHVRRRNDTTSGLSGLDVVSRGRPRPPGPIAWPPRALGRPYWPKSRKNDRPGADCG